MSRINKRNIHQQQAGIASLLFTLVMMIVISLIVLGFAQLARRDQRETLDSQLSTQAYYAAESAVNDAVNVLQSGYTPVSGDDTSCTQFYSEHSLDPVLSPATQNNVAYTCLEVNADPQDKLDFNNITTNTAEVVPILPSGGTLNDLEISWTPSTSTGSASDCANNSKLPQDTSTAWACPFAVMQLDMVPQSDTDSRADLSQNTMTTFLKPDGSGGGGSVAFSSSAPKLNNVRCTNNSCTATISNLGGQAYELRLSSLYSNPADVTISPGDPGVTLGGAQAVIDATGRAQDVLRRLVVYVPLGAQAEPVDGAIDSNQAICKRFSGGVGLPTENDTSDESGCSLLGSDSTPPPDNPNPPNNGDPNANLTAGTCTPESTTCDGNYTGPGSSYQWTARLYNHSVNSVSVKNCEWSINDGQSTTSSGLLPGSDESCQTYEGSVSVGTYPYTLPTSLQQSLIAKYPYPLLCTTNISNKVSIKATLTITLVNGETATDISYFNLPRCYVG